MVNLITIGKGKGS